VNICAAASEHCIYIYCSCILQLLVDSRQRRLYMPTSTRENGTTLLHALPYIPKTAQQWSEKIYVGV